MRWTAWNENELKTFHRKIVLHYWRMSRNKFSIYFTTEKGKQQERQTSITIPYHTIGSYGIGMSIGYLMFQPKIRYPIFMAGAFGVASVGVMAALVLVHDYGHNDGGHDTGHAVKENKD